MADRDSIHQRIELNCNDVAWWWMPQQHDDGHVLMATDEALLDWIRLEGLKTPSNCPIILVRTYRWSRPTISLGVHQRIETLHPSSIEETFDYVRRPTGGRAILHGEDVSFAFITNHPRLLNASLDDSYCWCMTWIRQTLGQLGLVLADDCTVDRKAYVRSSLCFETQTPSDLSDAETGKKVAGSAQVRRQGGLLQHGAAFLQPFHIAPEPFDQALQTLMAQTLGIHWNRLDSTHYPPELQTLLQLKKKDYQRDSDRLRERLFTTSGSQRVPASD